MKRLLIVAGVGAGIALATLPASASPSQSHSCQKVVKTIQHASTDAEWAAMDQFFTAHPVAYAFVLKAVGCA